jgi:chorismate mutase
MVWIGARSTVNPFTVQELSEALQGSQIPVMVKNPVNPDLKLWLGAIERLERHGIQVLGAIHRGFSVYEKTNYRNNPHWQIAIDLKQERPALQLVMDPSHIGGRANLIQPLAQQALDLNYDGLMIESHIDPTAAWTDAKQQITPEALKEIFAGLEPRNPAAKQANALAQFREQLSFIDESLINLLQQRMSISKEIGIYKRQHNQHILQAQRWEETLKANLQKALDSGLSEEFARQMIKMLHEESLRIQMAINSLSDNENQGQ